MGFFGFLKTNSVAPNIAQPKGGLCIIDVASVLDSSGSKKGNRIHPRDNFMALKSLALFSERENMQMIAVVTGKELKEAKNGHKFKGITVYYTDEQDATRSKILGIAKKYSGKHPVIVTCEPETEKKAAHLNISLMRPSTLKKVGIALSDDRDQRNKNNGNRKDRDDKRRNHRNHEKKTGDKPEDTQEKQQSEIEDPEILSLIDPV